MHYARVWSKLRTGNGPKSLIRAPLHVTAASRRRLVTVWGPDRPTESRVALDRQILVKRTSGGGGEDYPREGGIRGARGA